MIDPDAPLLIVTARWPAPSETFILRDLIALQQTGMPFQLLALEGRPGIVIEGIVDRDSARDGFAADYDGLITILALVGDCDSDA